MTRLVTSSSKWLDAHKLSTGKVGAVGFRFGSGMVYELAIQAPETVNAGVPFYGRQPELSEAPKNDAPLLIHNGSLDKRIVSTAPAFEKALKEHGKNFVAYVYEGANHGSHNDSTPCYDEAAAKLARLASHQKARRRGAMQGTEPFPSIVVMSPSGDLIAAARDNPEGSITLWDAATGEVQGSVTAPFPARQLLFSPGGDRLAVWDGEKNLVFVDAASRELGEAIELPAPGHFPQFVRDGRLAFLTRSGSATEPRWTAVVVDPETGRAEERSPSWSSDLPSFGDAVFDDELDHAFVIAHPDNAEPDDRIYVFDLKTGAAVATLDGHFAPVLQLNYRGDAQRLYSLGRDRHLMEWDVSPTGLKAASENDKQP